MFSICRPLSVICLLSSAFLILASCKTNPAQKTDPAAVIESPAFSADSAYAFVAKQVSFGPRVPGSQAHGSCMEWMVATLRNFGAEVMVQKGLAKIYDGTVLPVQNIIARFQPEKVNRILLMAHWDSRPFADQDSDPVKKDFPIAGANDGASGVGVLMEIARQLGQKPATLGIDIILYDLEDYGVPAHKDIEWKADSWCLGSQYWAHNPHIPGYFARYGILLDMVGAPDARFTQEEVSRYYAKSVVDKVWNTAYQLGFGRYFPFDQTPQLIDDHRYVNEIIGIPSIDIIHQDPTTESSFPTTWHTQEDNMQHISRETLGAVGKVVLAVVYVEK
ncbi:MAG TPA: glutamine cyclotransferase [Bacteroidales bacterium]|nr:glutamine cyclotransferase [Bacteroidales bacterium]